MFDNTDKKLIGMIHLPPSIGYSSSPGEEAIIAKALTDLSTLEGSGFDGVLIENDNDQPHQISVTKKVRESFKRVVKRVVEHSRISVGMELIYDMRATVDIAAKVGCDFARLDVFVDAMQTKWGIVPACAGEIGKMRRSIGSKLKIITDVHVKHAKMVAYRPLSESTVDSISHGSDGIVVTGDWTGIAPNMTDVMTVHEITQRYDSSIYIGSGVNIDNINELLRYADGVIVGTSIKTNGYIDKDKAAALVDIVRKADR